MPGNNDAPTYSDDFIFRHVLTFDGKPSELESFITHFEMGYRLANNSQKLQMLHIAALQLIGPAKKIGINPLVQTWDDMKNKLVQTFGERKTLEILINELQRFQQKAHQPLEDYIKKLKELLNNCMDRAKTEALQKNDTPEALKSKRDLIESLALATFKTGIRSREIASVLRIEKPKTLDEASTLALDEEIQINSFDAGFSNNNNYRNNNNNRFNRSRNNNNMFNKDNGNYNNRNFNNFSQYNNNRNFNRNSYNNNYNRNFDNRNSNNNRNHENYLSQHNRNLNNNNNNIRNSNNNDRNWPQHDGNRNFNNNNFWQY
ncbi:MAG: hypothetical protein ACRCTJ_03840, partial [Brevinema sp.]